MPSPSGSRRGQAERRAAGALCVLGALTGCALQPPVAREPAHPPPTIEPVEVTTTYIATYTRRFVRGQFAIVEVCIAADGSIAGTRVVQSSTDRAYDEAAMAWARQARYRPQLENGQPVYGCQQVRVEVNPNPAPHTLSGADNALG